MSLIGKKHALKKYDQFTINITTPVVVQFHEIFITTIINKKFIIIVEAKIS